MRNRLVARHSHRVGYEMKKESGFKNFDRMMRKLLSVPHSEVKTKLDAEKVAKKKKRKGRK